MQIHVLNFTVINRCGTKTRATTEYDDEARESSPPADSKHMWTEKGPFIATQLNSTQLDVELS